MKKLMEEIAEAFEDEKFARLCLRLIIGTLVFLAVDIFLFKYVLMKSMIPSGSMEGTLLPGDRVISTRLNLSEETIHRYDILIFHTSNDPDNLLIKRVIGLPGEIVVIKDGKVYVDGVETDDSFVNGTQNDLGSGIYVVPEGCYFFLGDNRNHSKDSRFMYEMYIPIENICAKARFVVFPFSRMGSVEYE